MDANQANIMLPDWYPTSFVSSALILMVYGIARSIVFYLRNYLSGATGQTFNRYLRERFVRYSLNNVQSIQQYELNSLFNERIQQASAVLQYFIFFIINFVSLIFFGCLGLKIAPYELIFGLIALAIFMLPFQLFNKRISGAGNSLVTEWNTVSKTISNGFKNYYFLKLYGLIDGEVDKAKKSLLQYESHYKNYFALSSLKLAFPVFIGSFVVSVITIISFKYWHTSGAQLLAFYYIFIRLAQAASDSSSVISVMKLNIPGFKILLEWHHRANTYFMTSDQAKRLEVTKSSEILTDIEFKNVNFGYETVRVLKDLSFHLKTGQIFLVKGESGSGKSTIVSLITGINKPLAGTMSFNHKDQFNIQDYYSQIAYVGPDPYLIAGTVKENLLYGHQNPLIVQDEEIWSALQMAFMKKEIENLPQKLNQFLNEQTELSTGQKQRLSIARAFLRKPKLLILDEATANIDKDNEEKIIHNLGNLKKDKMIFVISHKPSFDLIADGNLHLEKL